MKQHCNYLIMPQPPLLTNIIIFNTENWGWFWIKHWRVVVEWGGGRLTGWQSSRLTEERQRLGVCVFVLETDRWAPLLSSAANNCCRLSVWRPEASRINTADFYLKSGTFLTTQRWHNCPKEEEENHGAGKLNPFQSKKQAGNSNSKDTRSKSRFSNP